MKIKIKLNSASQWFRLVIFLVIAGLNLGCNSNTSETKVLDHENDNVNKEVIWHVKAIHPEGRTIDVKALDKEGNIYDVKAIQDAEQRQLIDIKAFVGGAKLPVKILVSDDQYAPVKAIGEGGIIYDIKALTSGGDILDVKGVSQSGNIINIKAINKEGGFYGIKAISPDGQLNDVKGVKMTKDQLETTIKGVKVHAHIKALPQAGCPGKNSIWHVKAIHPEGRTIDVKALDKEGKIYDVKAIQDADQRQLLDIKAFVGDAKLPVKILVSDDQYAPVKAIGIGGVIYDIKAITSDGDIFDVKGVGQSGNIINIKAINKEGEFYGIKAISTDGQLNDVKGIKMIKDQLETTIEGVEVHAHIKGLVQIE